MPNNMKSDISLISKQLAIFNEIGAGLGQSPFWKNLTGSGNSRAVLLQNLTPGYPNVKCMVLQEERKWPMG